MPGTVQTKLGNIIIQEDVFAALAGLLTVENYGIIGMASKKATDGFWELLGRENVAKGVQISINENKLIIDLYVMVQYGVSINAVAENIIDNVAYQIQTVTGMSVHAVNVHVEGVRVEKD